MATQYAVAMVEVNGVSTADLMATGKPVKEAAWLHLFQYPLVV